MFHACRSNCAPEEITGFLLIEINSGILKALFRKLFEYMVSNKPIIAIGPKDSDFAEIITIPIQVFF
jgi:hypothetical protein